MTRVTTWVGAAGVAGAAVLLAGCMQMDAPSAQVSRTDYGDDWPLTLSSGRVSCELHDQVIFLRDGTQYALSGHWKGSAYASIDHIWADVPGGTGKMDLAPLVERGRRLCR